MDVPVKVGWGTSTGKEGLLSSVGAIYTAQDEATEFGGSHAHLLAVAISTSYGGQRRLERDHDRPSQIARVVSMSLVLHGSSSHSDAEKQ